MKKKLFISVLSLLLAVLLSTGAAGISFEDVPKNHWGYDAIMWAYDAGLMKGISNTEFDPNGSVTRGMFVSILYRLAQSRGENVEIAGTASFPDVKAGQWYTNGVLWAAEHGIAAGLPGGKFGVNEPITREQMATMVCRYIEDYMYYGLVAFVGDLDFKDGDKIASWAKIAVIKFKNMGIVVGDGSGNFQPGSKTTRASAAVIFYKLVNFLETNVDTHTHEFAPTAQKDPTCVKDGYYTETCTGCGGVRKQILKALGHTLVNDQRVNPTCTKSGLTAGTHCTRCNAVLVRQLILPALGHKPVTDPGYAPTCMEKGLTDGTHCSVCSAVIVRQTAIPATGHKAVEVGGTPATCTKSGMSSSTVCSVCHVELTSAEILPPLGHDVKLIPGTPATCTENGLSDSSVCRVCGVMLISPEPVPPLGHDVELVPGTAPGCMEPGISDSSVCRICGVMLISPEPISPLGHDVQLIPGTPATCTENGLSDSSVCRVCNAMLISPETIYPLGHSFGEWRVYSPREERRFCTRCTAYESRARETGNGRIVRPAPSVQQPVCWLGDSTCRRKWDAVCVIL